VVRRDVGIDVGAPPRPTEDKRLAFIRRYADDSGDRLAALGTKDATWWAEEVAFFDTRHNRAWIMGEGEARGGAKAPLPGPGRHASTERPER